MVNLLDKDILREILREELNPLKIEFEHVKIKVDETYEIVKALEHSSEVNRA